MDLKLTKSFTFLTKVAGLLLLLILLFWGRPLQNSVSDRIRIKLGRIVLQVNMRRFKGAKMRNVCFVAHFGLKHIQHILFHHGVTISGNVKMVYIILASKHDDDDVAGL